MVELHFWAKATWSGNSLGNFTGCAYVHIRITSVCIDSIPVDSYLDVTGKKGDYLEEAVVQGSVGKEVA